MRKEIEQVADTLGKYLLKCLPKYDDHQSFSESVVSRIHQNFPNVASLVFNVIYLCFI